MTECEPFGVVHHMKSVKLKHFICIYIKICVHFYDYINCADAELKAIVMLLIIVLPL